MYYLGSRYYDSVVKRFINADNNFSNNNLYMYCGNNPVNRVDKNGEHWYYLWLDDLIEGINQLMASVSNIIYGKEAMKKSFTDPQGAQELWNERPFQETKPSQEMQIFTDIMYENDITIDFSLSIPTPVSGTYVKVGVSKLFSANKDINATYLHIGGGVSMPPTSFGFSPSVGIVKGENNAMIMVVYL